MNETNPTTDSAPQFVITHPNGVREIVGPNQGPNGVDKIVGLVTIGLVIFALYKLVRHFV
jgi:hypothetical protein